MQKKFLLIVAMFFSAIMQLKATDVSGTISTNTTWNGAGSPYFVTGNITVSASVLLKIEPGVKVLFNSNTQLLIRGELEANGVLFSSNVSPKGRGDWRGIQIGDNYYEGKAQFYNCTVEYAGRSNYGSIYAYRGKVTIDNCSISNSLYAGILIHNRGDVSIQNSGVSNNVWPVVFNDYGTITDVTNNSFTGNDHDVFMVGFNNLYVNWTLPTSPLPYYFYHHYYIQVGGKLTVPINTIIKSDSWIEVRGAMLAEASSGKEIIFTSYKDDNHGGDSNGDGAATSPGRSSWGGIWFDPSSNDAECKMIHCHVFYGGAGNHGGINVENASPTITDCFMRDNYIGAKFIGASYPTFQKNEMASSGLVPVAMSFDANPNFGSNNSFSFSDNQYDAICLLEGKLTADAKIYKRDVIDLPNVSYLMLGNLTIPDGFKLEIDPGIVIKTRGNYAIITEGILKALGTQDEPIIFTSAKDDKHGNPKDTNKDGTQTNPEYNNWSGIIFENSSDDAECKLDHCYVKYASMSSRYYNGQYISGGAITTENAGPTISNCQIQDVSYGIYAFQDSDPDLKNITISNARYTPIALSITAKPSFSNIDFVNSAWTALGIIGEKVGVGGTLPKRTVAGFDNISYILLGNLTINSGTEVAIDPGVILKMNNNVSIFIDGGFATNGTSTDTVVVTSIHDDNYGNPKDTHSNGNATKPDKGNWGAIHFRGTSDDSFCHIQGSLLKFGGRSNSGILRFTDANTKVASTTLSDGGGFGIRVEGASEPELLKSIQIQNMSADPIAMSLVSKPKMDETSPKFASLGNGSNGIRILEGNLSTTTTLSKRKAWNIPNVAYVIENLTIKPSTTLTIDKGVVMKFTTYYYGIDVQGALVAEGTDTEPIVFTSIKDDSKGGDTNDDGNTTAPDRGNWRSVNFSASSLDNLNKMEHCIVNYAGNSYGNYTYNRMGCVRIYDAKVVINKCRLEHSSSSAIGIFGGANPTITGNEMNNISLTPITLSMFANHTFANNTISNVGIYAIGLAQETFSVDATVPIRNFAGFNNMTYYVYKTLSINSGTHITIPNGVVFKSRNINVFDVSGWFSVGGSGTMDEPVVFTHEYDDTYGNPKDTNNDADVKSPTNTNGAAIVFRDLSDDNSSVTNTLMRYSKYGVWLEQAAPDVINSTFENLQWGVVLKGVSEPKVNNNRFVDLTYTPLLTSLVSVPTYSGNKMEGQTWTAIGVISEELVQDATLTKQNFAGKENIPYYFSGNYTVGTSVTLTINPGVVCKFAQNATLAVERGLQAIGDAAPDKKIVFTDYRDDFYGGDTNSDGDATLPSGSYNWKGIHFKDVSLDALCELKHCIIRYAGYYNNEAAITTTAASPKITYTVITNSRNAIRANGSSAPIINECDLYNNTDFTCNNVNLAQIINARNNWWGSNTGPTHSSNPGGTGGLISNKVDYTGFYTSGAMNPLMGDVSLNGFVQAYDAALVLRHSVGVEPLPLPRQKVVADVTADGNITAADATDILKHVAGIISVFEAELKTAQLPEAELELSDFMLTENGQLELQLSMRKALRVESMDIVAHFNSNLLRMSEVVPSEEMEGRLFAHNNGANGELRIGIAGISEMNNKVALATIRFQLIQRDAIPGSTRFNFSKILVNEINVTDNTPEMEVFIPSTQTTVQDVLASSGLPLVAYPNPAAHLVNVAFKVTSNSPVAIHLIDASGKQVRTLITGTYPKGNQLVPVQLIEKPGFYSIRYISGNHVSYQQLIIK